MKKFLFGLIGVAMLVFVGIAFFAIARPVKVLPRMAMAPGYVLTDQTGNRLTNEDLRGSIVLYSFASTGCGAECAAVQQTLRELKDELGAIDTQGVPVRLVTISIDPERDSPARLAEVAPALGADGEVWRFATADAATVKQVVGGGFGVFYEPRPDDGVRLDPVLVLVDGWGITRAEHRVGIPESEHLAYQIQLLGNEIRASQGVARLAYEAAHLFACYP